MATSLGVAVGSMFNTILDRAGSVTDETPVHSLVSKRFHFELVRRIRFIPARPLLSQDL